MHHCPRCETKARVIEVRRQSNGDKRRRLECQNTFCGHRWTAHERSTDPKPKPVAKARPRRRRAAGEPDLTDEQLLMIFQRVDLNNTQLARIMDRSRELIRQVRAGLVYRDRLPQIVRAAEAPVPDKGHRCEQCNQWLGYCTMGFPDPLLEGTAFANECVTFSPRGKEISRASAETSLAAVAR
jgi:transcriptional regulator NrdR family protein